MNTPVATKIEYFVLPSDSSHIRDVLYRVYSPKASPWHKATFPTVKLKKGVNALFSQFSCFYTPTGVVSNSTKAKYHELKLVRKISGKKSRSNASKRRNSKI